MRERYRPSNNSRQRVALPPQSAATGTGVGKGLAPSCDTMFSISASVRSASAMRPREASQRGDSWQKGRITAAIAAGATPIMNIHCQP